MFILAVWLFVSPIIAFSRVDPKNLYYFIFPAFFLVLQGLGLCVNTNKNASSHMDSFFFKISNGSLLTSRFLHVVRMARIYQCSLCLEIILCWMDHTLACYMGMVGLTLA